MHLRSTVLVMALAFAMTGPAAAIVPTAAVADTAIKVVQIPCPGWVPSAVGVYGMPEYVISANETFQPSESRIVVNDLDTPVTATFSSQTSRTFTIAVQSGVSFNNLLSFMNVNVSTTITSSTTTQLGVSTTATVPAHGAVIGDYGVNVYDVTFMGYVINRRAI